MTTVETIKDFLSFLKKPRYTPEQEVYIPFGSIINVFVLVFFTSIFIYAPIAQLLELDESTHMMQELIENTSKLNLFLLAVVIAPILEEFLFRFHLRYKLLMFVFVLSCILALVYKLICSVLGIGLDLEGLDTLVNMSEANSYSSVSWNRYAVYLILGLFTVFVSIMASYFSNLKFRSVVNRYLKENFGFVFYLTAIVFGLAHISNWTESDLHILFTPLLVLPQLILALYLGYIRTKVNIWMSIAVHAMNNMIPITLIFLGQYLDIPI